MHIAIVYVICLYINTFSVKACIQCLKDDMKSIVFDKDGHINNITFFINDLIMHGIHGPLKKENVITTLQELVVSKMLILADYV